MINPLLLFTGKIWDVLLLLYREDCFDKVVQWKYSQSVPLKGKYFDFSTLSLCLLIPIVFAGKGQGLVITPLPAGHMLGGTVWTIVKDGEEDIINVVDYNHKKDRHLNGCELEKIQRPSLLITDAYNTRYRQLRRRTRHEQLMTNILQTLRGGRNVLVAVDTAGRPYLNNVTYNVNQFANRMDVWQIDEIIWRSEKQSLCIQVCLSYSNVCDEILIISIGICNYVTLCRKFFASLDLKWSCPVYVRLGVRIRKGFVCLVVFWSSEFHRSYQPTGAGHNRSSALRPA